MTRGPVETRRFRSVTPMTAHVDTSKLLSVGSRGEAPERTSKPLQSTPQSLFRPVVNRMALGRVGRRFDSW